MNTKRFPWRWWITTVLGALLGSQIFLGLYMQWPVWVLTLLLLAFCALLIVIERQNERETDLDEAWWVPTRVLWATPLRAVQSAGMVLLTFVVAGFVVFGGVSLWTLGVVIVGTYAYRVIVGRRWLKRDRAAADAADAVEDSEKQSSTASAVPGGSIRRR